MCLHNQALIVGYSMGFLGRREQVYSLALPCYLLAGRLIGHAGEDKPVIFWSLFNYTVVDSTEL